MPKPIKEPICNHYMDEAEYCDRVSMVEVIILRPWHPKELKTVPSGLYERRVSKTGP
jgi:hypothetical protein